MRPCAAKVTRQGQLWLQQGLRQGVRYKKQGLVCGFDFPRKKRAASHIPGHLLELSLGRSGRRTWSLQCSYHPFLVCRTQAPGTEKKSP